MFKIEKTGKNAFKYLTDCENQHLGLNNQIFAKEPLHNSISSVIVLERV